MPDPIDYSNADSLPLREVSAFEFFEPIASTLFIQF